jgi:hypothetical protein
MQLLTRVKLKQTSAYKCKAKSRDSNIARLLQSRQQLTSEMPIQEAACAYVCNAKAGSCLITASFPPGSGREKSPHLSSVVTGNRWSRHWYGTTKLTFKKNLYLCNLAVKSLMFDNGYQFFTVCTFILR